jgi:hypothetical protein
MMTRRRAMRSRAWRSAAIAALLSLAQFASIPMASGHDDEPHHPPGTPATDSGANPQAGVALDAVDDRWWEGDDFLVTARPSAEGYSLLIGWERQKYVFRPLATIQPGGYGDDVWLGYHCLTGDRQHVVVSLLPRWAVNRLALRDRGALVYVVTVATGEVRPLVKGVAFKRHAVGCGAGSQLALLRHLDTDQARTELLVADAARASVRSVGTFQGQLTWPVPGPGGRVLALRNSTVVEATAGRPSLEPVTRVAGEAYNLVATSDGRTSLLALGQDRRVTGFDLAGRRAVEVGSGPADQVRLLRTARNGAFFGLDRLRSRPATPAAIPTAPGAGGGPPRRLVPETVSAEGKVVLAATAPRQDVEATRRVAAQRRSDSSNEQLEPTKRLFWTGSGEMLHGQSPQGRSPEAVEAVPTFDGSGQPGVTSTTPTCGVPRNEPRRTAYGATNVQASWAVEMASRELLVGQNARPANYLSSGLAGYSPSIDFDLPALRPAGGNVPPAVMNAILAQESAYRQASRRTLPGSGGNPVIADYYGANGTLDIIDYANADCGYGISQVTTGMRISETSISPNGKAKVAIDYAENIQAGMNILVKKWNQLYGSNIRLNDSNPAYVENWYFALWAYNSGVQPDARFGNTSGCTPGPSCTDQYGNWGLGWTNNPRNSDYPPTRTVFLRETYADAENPSDWPYQERILGWAETPVKNFRGDPAYAPAVAGPNNPSGVVTYPDRLSFCTDSNSCDPTATTGEGCRRADFRCWWHESITVFSNCAGTCARSPFTWAVDSREPAGENPWRPECNSSLGPGAVIVDDLNDPSANIFCPSRNWQNRGTFTYTVGSNTAGQPLGIIDFHQVATGLGAHTWFAGNRVASDTAHRVTGIWRPANLAAGTYVVKAHIPTAGAGTESAVYKVTTIDGSVRQRTINQHEHYNHWKTIGVYQLGPNAQVELTNVTAFDTQSGKGTVAWDAVAFVPAPGRYEEQSVEVYAQFDEDTNVDVNAPTSWISGVMRSRAALYQWATGRTGAMLNLPSCSGAPSSSCLTAQTRTAMSQWRQDVLAAGTDPVNHPDGKSIATWLALANDYRDRPSSTTKPVHYDYDNDVHKIKTKATVSYVIGSDGRIVEGSEDVVYQHYTGDTHLPDFIRGYLSALTTDYGVQPPNLQYSTVDLRVHNHQTTTARPNVDGRLPGRAYAAAGKRPVVTNYDGTVAGSAGERNCVAALYVSGGTIGYRPMLGVGYVSAEVEAWMRRVQAHPAIPDAVATLATDIYEVFFKQSGVIPSTSILFEYAPPIWQELNFRVCTDRSIRHLNRPILRASFMPHQYLYHNNRAIDETGSAATSAAPVMVGDFQPFSNPPAVPPWLPFNYDNPFGGCDWDTGRRGNPWNMLAQGGAAFNPPHAHFCVDARIPTDPDYG